MNAERWREVREALDRALELAPGERATWLEAESARDPELALELASLLGAAQAAENFLETPPGIGHFDLLATATTDEDGAAAEAELARVEPGMKVGPYRIVREVGHGGMGTVFLGERDGADFAQRVAIKVIRRGMDTELVVGRFLAERRILAALDHPNIARLLDGGTTEDGLPFFVMEYIEGESLLDYCDTRRLSVAGRLALMGEVCRAVQYAHQRLVVHRDLKPSNILVTAEGTPKLLDFGLSRVLNPDETGEAHGLTALGLRMMTPEYASPEQARGDLVTTASDVYSLGILLFELLTGRRPYRLRSRRAEDLERAICGEVPERPSAAASKAGEIDTPAGTVALSPEAASEVREGSVARLRRALAGDLDNIVLKALRKEPERRYASAGELADDLRRHLAGLPVSARRDTFAYRAAKFARRRAVPLATAAAMAALLSVLVGLHTAQLARERDRAELESAQARELAGFLSSLFELSDLDRTKGEKLSARDILDRGAARIESELGGQPEVAAKMMRLIAGVYRQLGLPATARPLLEKALDERRKLHGERDLEVASTERDLAAVLHSTGEEEGAAALLRQAIHTETELDPAGVELARSHSTLGNVLKRQGDIPGATAEFAAALTILDRTPPPDESALARTLGNYGLFLATIGQGAKGVPYLRRTMEITDRLMGPESPGAGADRLNLGAALRQSGEFDEAIARDREALAITGKTYGRIHVNYAKNLDELGSSWAAKGEIGLAKASFLEALPIYDQVLGPDHPDALSARRNYAIVLASHGEERAALPLFMVVLAARERRFGPGHPAVAESLFDVAGCRRSLGDTTGVEAMMRRGLAIDRATLGADSGSLAGALFDLGSMLCDRGPSAEGRALIEEATAILHRAPNAYAPGAEELARAAERCASRKR